VAVQKLTVEETYGVVEQAVNQKKWAKEFEKIVQPYDRYQAMYKKAMEALQPVVDLRQVDEAFAHDVAFDYAKHQL
jgi:hypothetical protein